MSRSPKGMPGKGCEICGMKLELPVRGGHKLLIVRIVIRTTKTITITIIIIIMIMTVTILIVTIIFKAIIICRRDALGRE